MIRIEVTDEYEDWWNSLEESVQDDVIAMVELLAERGVRLPYPYSSGVESSKFSHMRELRVQSQGRPIRIFYAFDPRRVAILLTGGSKKGNERQFYKKYVPLRTDFMKCMLTNWRERNEKKVF